MKISREFSKLPPIEFLVTVLDQTGRVYVYLWGIKDKDIPLTLFWKDIRKTFNKNSFKTAVRKLCNDGLLSYEENDFGVSIELKE